MGETELKFVIDESAVDEVWKRYKASTLACGRRRTGVLESIYLDTPDHALSKQGIALRLRRDGRQWIQTVKAKRQLHGGLSQSGEIEVPARQGKVSLEAIADPELRGEIIALVNGSPLQPVCETQMKRTTGELRLEDGARAVLATDIGEIRAQGRSEKFNEAEIKLIEGCDSGLFDIAHALFPQGGLSFSRLSKGQRGYLLASEGRIDLPTLPRKAVAVPLNADQTAEQAARDVLRECLDQIAINVGVVETLDDPEGPHQLRVGLRRLRSALTIFAPVLEGPEGDRLNAEARWLGTQVGHLRDLDAITNDIILKLAATRPDETGLVQLAEALRDEAAGVRKDLRCVLIGARTQALLIDLARFVETRGWLVPSDVKQTRRLAAPVKILARAALDKRCRRVRKRARKLVHLTPPERHELRKELKKLRYAVEFLGPLFPESRVKPFLRHLKDLQDVFADLNDANVLKALLSPSGSSLATEPRLQHSIKWVIGVSEARAEDKWHGAKALWQSLKETRPFWKRVLRPKSCWHVG